MIGLIVPGVSAEIGGDSSIKIEIETENDGNVYVSGQLANDHEEGANPFVIRYAEITLIPSNFIFSQNVTACKVSELPNCVLKTDSKGKFEVAFYFKESEEFEFQAIFDGNEQWGPSKTNSLSFTTFEESTQTKSSTQTTKSPFIFPNLFERTEIIFAVIIIGVIIGIIIAVRKRKINNGNTEQDEDDEDYDDETVNQQEATPESESTDVDTPITEKFTIDNQIRRKVQKSDLAPAAKVAIEYESNLLRKNKVRYFFTKNDDTVIYSKDYYEKSYKNLIKMEIDTTRNPKNTNWVYRGNKKIGSNFDSGYTLNVRLSKDDQKLRKDLINLFGKHGFGCLPSNYDIIGHRNDEYPTDSDANQILEEIIDDLV